MPETKCWPWPPDPSQTASGKPGAVQSRLRAMARTPLPCRWSDPNLQRRLHSHHVGLFGTRGLIFSEGQSSVGGRASFTRTMRLTARGTPVGQDFALHEVSRGREAGVMRDETKPPEFPADVHTCAAPLVEEAGLSTIESRIAKLEAMLNALGIAPATASEFLPRCAARRRRKNGMTCQN